MASLVEIADDLLADSARRLGARGALPEDMRARVVRIVMLIEQMSQRVVIWRVFIKKTKKTPRREIDLALSRARPIKATEK